MSRRPNIHRFGALLAVVGVLACGLSAGIRPAAAQSTGSPPFTLFRFGVNRETNPDRVAASADQYGKQLTIAVPTENQSVTVAAPTGKSLVVGKRYDQTTVDGAGGTPRLSATTCFGNAAGAFVVDQLDRNVAGELTAVAVRYACTIVGRVSWTSAARQATVPVYDRTVVASSSQFVPTEVGVQAPPVTVTLANTGPSPLPVAGWSLAGSPQASVLTATDGCSARTLAPGSSCTVQVVATPTALQSESVQVLLADGLTGSAAPEAVVSVSVTGSTRPGPARLDIDTSWCAMAGCGASITTNTPKFDATATNFTVENPAYADPEGWGWRLTFAPGPHGPLREGLTFPIRSLLKPDPQSGTVFLTVDHLVNGATHRPECPDLAGSVTIERLATDRVGAVLRMAARFDFTCGSGLVVGRVSTGYEPVLARDLDTKRLVLGGAGPGQVTSRTLTLTNTGTAPLPVHHVGLTGPDEASFDVDDQCGGRTIAAGSTCQIEVSLAPDDLRAYDATLEIADGFTGADHAFNVPVSGWGGAVPTPGVGEYTPVAPSRILDTRVGPSPLPAGTQVEAGRSLRVKVTGAAGVPKGSRLVSAVALNVTVTGPTRTSFLTVYPGGSPRPVASNLNFKAGQTVANLVITGVGADGTVDIALDAGAAHVVFDVVGWVGGTDQLSAAGRLLPQEPVRLLDTREGGHGHPVGPGRSVKVRVSPPGSAITAAVVNLTGTMPTAYTFLTAHPTGQPLPVASNLNLAPGQTRPNLAIVPVAADGTFTVYNDVGDVHVIVDLVGVVVDVIRGGIPLNSYAGRILALDSPARIIETRVGPQAGRIGPGQVDSWDLGPLDSIAGIPIAGVIANVTATGASRPTFLTVFPDVGGVPTASNLNVVPGEDVPNLTLSAVSDDGFLAVYNSVGDLFYLADLAAVVLGEPTTAVASSGLPQTIDADAVPGGERT